MPAGNATANARGFWSPSSTWAERGLGGVMITAVIFVVIGCVGLARSQPRSDPDYVPTCQGKPMQRSDVCIVNDSMHDDHGRFTYDQMVGRHYRDARFDRRFDTWSLAIAGSLAVILLATMIVVRRRGTRDRLDAEFIAAAQALGRRLDDPLDVPRDPGSGARLGALRGTLDGTDFLVRCYEQRTELTLLVASGARTETELDLAPGQVRPCGDMAFARAVATPQFCELAARLGISDLSATRVSLGRWIPPRPSAAQVHDGLRGLLALAEALPRRAWEAEALRRIKESRQD